MKNSIAVITGDIINSTKHNTSQWQRKLKQVLSQYGKETYDWEIHRGDFFQIRVPALKSIRVAIHIKAAIKELHNELDVRMSIGIGKQTHKNKKISLSTGEAYTLSGRGFDKLKKQNLIITTTDEFKNNVLNTIIVLALIPMNKWTKTEAKIFLLKFLQPNLNLKQMSSKLKKSTSTISETLKRAAYSEISLMEKTIQKIIQS